MAGLAIALPLLALASRADPYNQSHFTLQPGDRCTSFPSSVSSPSLTVIDATYYPTGSTVDLANGQAFVNTTELPAFCRLVLNITTNPETGKQAGAEVWLPDAEEWNSRVFGFGLGAWGGGVPYGAIALDGLAQGYVAYGTDGGHVGNMWNGSFGGPHNDDAIVDLAWRALHLTTVHAKELAAEFYGRNHTKSYFSGCSTGGRQGIKAMVAFPEDYDGLLLGAPANPFGHIMPWMARQSQLVRPVGSATWIPAETWDLIHAEAVRQCDALDGVKDGIISNPENCPFRPETLACRPNTTAPSTCLTPPQLHTLSRLYSPYIDPNGTYLSSGFVPGAEYAYPLGLVGTEPFPMPADYYRYLVLNDTTWDESRLDEETVQLGIDLNPGSMDIKWYRDVYAHTMTHSSLDPDDSFRLFTVPGMMHCFNRNGATAFGGWSQRSFAPPLKPEAGYDIQASMVEWVEKGRKVDHIVATKWKEDNVSLGVAFTRKLCPYPQQAVYIGGDESSESSFECR
ncbi:hypothetical protein QFC20_006855 [Naganishia adeliensis]|uniref:Uncharacterized protein n=1 Tax=Naganishia adeliensis TaxID=92952 RepID=A0ACC2V5N5_9TREE|nr:hypothetical protein QFC20_006855 [Naganishia adeliensis]